MELIETGFLGYKLENKAAVNQLRTPMVCYAPDEGPLKGGVRWGKLGGE